MLSNLGYDKAELALARTKRNIRIMSDTGQYFSIWIDIMNDRNAGKCPGWVIQAGLTAGVCDHIKV